MKIIIDSREQKPLKFPGHDTIVQKLDEGDYNIEILIPYIVIERKSLQDLYGTIFTTDGHARFKNEIMRSRLQGKAFYIFIEGSLEEFYSLKWSKRDLKIKPSTMKKTINTMIERYNLIFVECKSREHMAKLIVQTLEINKKLKTE